MIQTMPLFISEKIEEEDYEPLFAIQFKAFVNEPALRAVYPGGLDPSSRAHNVARFKAALGFTRPNVRVAKVTDNETGQICAFATMPTYDENPLSGSEDSDIHFPHVDRKLRSSLEWIFNTKNDRRRYFKELQRPGSYCCRSNAHLRDPLFVMAYVDLGCMQICKP